MAGILQADQMHDFQLLKADFSARDAKALADAAARAASRRFLADCPPRAQLLASVSHAALMLEVA